MTDRLRVAIFSDSALPILNGVSVSIDQLVRALRRSGHSVHIFTAAHFGYRDPDPNTHRFPAVQTPWTRGYPLAFPPFYPMLHHFRRQEFDVVHTHTPWTIGFVGLRWAQSHGLPVVATYHTHYDKYTHYIPFLPKRYLRFKIAKHTNYYFNQVQQVITPSEASRRWLLRHSIRTPITVIPTGSEPPIAVDRAELRPRLGLPPEARLLLYVGRIAKEKNMGVLLEAVARVMQKDAEVHFWLVGDGPATNECRLMARELGIGDRTRFVGFVPRPQVDPYLAIADVFLFASMTETQGLVIQEAMSYGVPAVVVSGGGASSAIVNGENGLVVANDPDELGDAALALLRNDLMRTHMSAAARRTVKSYTSADMTTRVLGVYAEALNGSRVLASV